KTLSGRYRLEELIAEGGFGQVWRSTDLQLDRRVAVKITTLNCLDEARRVARLKHPGIVPVHDVGNDDGLCYIVFDLIDGATLAEHIAQSPPDPREAARLIAEIADRLEYAHRRGIIHRDVTPTNILLDADGKVHIADFGIAAADQEILDAARAGSGTLAYMAPEQLNLDVAQVDGRADVYSLGVVFHLLLSGRLPFAASSPSALQRSILRDDPPEVEDVPAELNRIRAACLSKSPADRPRSAELLARELRAFLKSAS
ncbi:MAG: serine/threonine protein kinase, partial [Planctomycetales bacterium]